MKKKALSLLLALTMCLTTLLPAAALDTVDAPEQTAAQEQTVSEGQETPASEEEQPAAAPAAESALLAAANGIATYDGDTHDAHNICGDANCPDHGGKGATWTAISKADDLQFVGDEKDPENTIYYCYLTKDIGGPSYDFTFMNAKNVVLCLNGFKITGYKDNSSSVFTVESGKTFTLCDCKGGGQISQYPSTNGYGGNAGGVKVEGGTFNLYGGTITKESGDSSYTVGVDVSGGTFNMYGGAIKGNLSSNKGGGVYVNGGAFNMSGGSITENCASSGSSDLPGGGVYVKSGTFTMTGGSITNNYPAGNGGRGGGVYVVADGTFTMRGGSISGNRVAVGEYRYPNGKGGGVYVGGGTFTMSGGRIYGNIANSYNSENKYGGGVYVESGTFTVSGDAYIAGNKVGATSASATETNNVYLASGTTITVGGKLNDGARIGVTTSTSGAAVATLAEDVTLTADEAAKFVSDNGSYRGKLSGEDNKSVVLASVPHKHCIYGEANCTTNGHTAFNATKELWMDPNGALWAGNTVLEVTTYNSSTKYYTLAADSYYLGSDLDLQYPLYITSGTVSLCLNGRELKLTPANGYDGYNVISLNTSGTILNLTDCQPGGKVGTVTHGEKADKTKYTGSGVYVNQGTTFNLYNGSITGNTASSGGGVYVNINGALFNMYGGSITGNTAASTRSGGGGVYICTTFNMYGGSITNNTATESGGGVYMENECTFTMTGGEITGNNKAAKSGGGVYVDNEGYGTVSAAVFNVSGAAKVTGNTVGGKASNVYLSKSDEGNRTSITVGGALTGTDTIGVTVQDAAAGVTVVSAASGYTMKQSDKDHFVSEDRDYTIEDKGGKLVLAKASDKPTQPTQPDFKFAKSAVTKTYGDQDFTAAATGAAAGSTVTYSSSDPTVATVDSSGKVHIRKAGTTTITATASATSRYAETQTSYTLTVNAQTTPGGGSSSGGGSSGGGSSGGGGSSSGGGGSSASTYPVSSSGTASGAVTGGSVSASTKNAPAGSTVSVTVTPEAGYRLEKLTVVDKNGKEIPVTLKDGKYTFTMPASQVDIKPVFEKIAAETAFPDVPSSAYYAEPVKWAAEKGITSGTKDGGFAPGNTCTRAQIVTFLWRAAGSPEPKNAQTGMTDISPEAYYAKAVAWAIENGITVGRSDGSFNPNGTCTRANGVTFLYRAAKAAAAGGDAGFRDVAADAYYAAAVQWAVENGITNGLGNGLFGSNGACTRAQIVTFLYRMYVKA